MSDFNSNCEAAADEQEAIGRACGYDAGYRARLNNVACDPKWLDRNNAWGIGYADGYADGIVDADDELLKVRREDCEELAA